MDSVIADPILFFTTLRVPLIILTLTILLNFIVLVFLEKKITVKQLSLINLLAIFFANISILTQSNTIVTQFGLVSDPFSYYLVLSSSIIFMLAIFIFTGRMKKEERERKKKMRRVEEDEKKDK